MRGVIFSQIANNRFWLTKWQLVTRLLNTGLHLVQSCLVYVNTLMAQEVLAEPKWYDRMTEADWRGLTPLFYLHVNPYGTFDLDMETRIPLQRQAETPTVN